MAIKRGALLAAIALGSAFTFLYLKTLTYAYSYDGLCYALDVEFGPTSHLFHPNHLLYTLIARALYRAALALGGSWRAIVWMQGMNAVVGGFAVALFYGVLRERFGTVRALIGALLLGFSRVFWEWAVDPGCYSWAVLGGVLLIWAYLKSDVWSEGRVALVQVLAVLFHQMYVLVIPGFGWKLRHGRPLIYLMLSALGIAGVYGGIGWIFYGNSLQAIAHWALRPAGWQPGTNFSRSDGWNFDVLNNLPTFGRTFLDSIVAWAPAPWHGPALVLRGMLVLCGVGVLWQMLRLLREKLPNRPDASGLWIWAISMGVFQLFYAASATRYCLLYFPALITAGLMTRRSAVATWEKLLALLLLGIGVVNYATVIVPQHRAQNNPDLLRAQWIAKTLRPGDGFLFSGLTPGSITNVYVAYFAPHIAGGSVQGYLFSRSGAGLSNLGSRLKGALAQKHAAYLEAALTNAGEQKKLEELGRLPAGTFERWLRAWSLGKELRGPGDYRILSVSGKVPSKPGKRSAS